MAFVGCIRPVEWKWTSGRRQHSRSTEGPPPDAGSVAAEGPVDARVHDGAGDGVHGDERGGPAASMDPRRRPRLVLAPRDADGVLQALRLPARLQAVPQDPLQ